MYCSNCGNATSAELKFCNSCGKRLAQSHDSDSTAGKMLDNILTTLFLVVMFGLGILVGLVAVLLSNGVDTKFVVQIAVIYLAAVFAICFMLLRQVPKLVDAKLRTNYEPQEFAPAVQLPPVTTAQLNESQQQPIQSVTEHTTRALEDVAVNR